MCSCGLREGRKERGSARASTSSGTHFPEFPQLLSLNHRHKLLPGSQGFMEKPKELQSLGEWKN